jgi:hypothetical protein
MTIVRQRLSKHIPDRYAVNKTRRPLLENEFGYHGIRHVSVTMHTTTTVLELFKEAISTRFAQGYKMKPEEIERQRMS